MGVTKDYVPRVIPGIAQRRRVTLTSAQILALNTTPVALVFAPGANKYVSVDEILVKGPAAGSTAYTGANAGEVRYTDGSGVKATGDLAAATINSITSVVDKLIASAVSTVPVNAAVVLSVPTANPGAGTGTITLDVLYRIVGLL